MKLTSALKANQQELMSIKLRHRTLTFTKQTCVEALQTGNWQGMRRLARICKRLRIHTIRDLYNRHWEDLWNAGAGYMTLLVATHLLDFAKFDSDEWISRGRRR